MDKLQNFVLGFIKSGELYDDEAYEIELAPGDVERFPDPAEGDFGAYDVVWYNSQDYADASLDPNKEIVRITAINGNVLTLANDGSARIPQQGTTASNKNTPFRKYAIYLATTKKTFDEINEAIETVAENATQAIGVVDARVDDADEAIGVVAQDLADFEQDTATALSGKVNNSEKGQANGVASLDGGGKVPVTQLPSSVMEFKGVWDATTNDPELADGTGNAGDVYLVSVAGTHDFGSGPISFALDDWVIYNGSVWQKSLNSHAVVSVNGYQGVVVLDKDDIGLGNVSNDAQLKIASNLSDLNNTATARTNLGLGNVDNTSDVNKPVSSATQTALNAKVTGPASVSNNAVAVFDGETGKLLKNSSVFINGAGVFIGTRTKFSSPADGQLLLQNAGGTDFGLLQFGGTTSSFPALKRSGTEIQARLANDSGNANFRANDLTSVGNLNCLGQIELGHASDTTITRASSGFIAVEGKRVPSPASQAEGDILYRGATEWERLPKGADGAVLTLKDGVPAWV